VRSGLLLALAGLAAGACGETRVVGSFDRDAGTTSEGGGGGTANIVIHVRATAAPVAHVDGLSGQTPRDEYIGVKAMQLLTSPADPSPFVIFEHPTYVEARLNDGDDTVIATVPASSVRPGQYSYVRTLVTHVRYKVDATVHASGVATVGEYENLLVLTNDTEVGGQKRQSGDLVSTFRGGGQTFGPTESKYPLPPRTEWAGVALEVSQGRAYYVYPATIVVGPPPATDVSATFEVNMHECFRWEDLPTAGYRPGVWDVELTGYEPVRQFGANSFSVRFQ
jgi:hypothetical protein